MQNNSAKARPALDQLIHELLGLDPQSLTHMDPIGAFVGIGLHELMRTTIRRALAALWAPAGTQFRLLPHGSKKILRELGWASVDGYNLSSVLAYALVSTPRRARGLPHIRLCANEENIIDLPWNVLSDQNMPMTHLVNAAISLFEVDVSAPGPTDAQTVSICDQIQERLGLSPEVLARPCYERQQDAMDAAARDPEGQATNGLATLLMLVLHTYQTIIAHGDLDDTSIRLMIADEERYTGVASARYANIETLFLAGLLAEAGHDMAFLIRDEDDRQRVHSV